MRVALVVSVAVLCACGASHTAAPPSPVESVRVVTASGMNLRTAGGDGAKVATLPFAIDRVWGAVPQVFDSLAIPIGNLDPATHVIGHNGFKITRKLGKVSLTRLLDCGNTQGSPSADTYEIQLSITTQLTAGALGTTKVATLVEAVGRPMAFAGEYVKCSTKGNLETMITDALAARLKPS